MFSTTQAATPLWTMTPTSGSQTTQTVPVSNSTTIQYTIQNQSSKAKRLVMKPIQGIVRTNPCQLAPNRQSGSSCILKLAITGSALPITGIHGGPVLCQANSDGSPNSNQCYQPSLTNSLNILPGPQIMVSPSSLSFVVDSSGLVTVTNNASSTQPVYNIVATIPGGSNISIQSSTCGASLAIGASCTITFTSNVVEGPTNISIRGSNSNTVSVPVTVTAAPTATINVNPTTLVFAENSTGDVTVTNTMGSQVSANNITANIPGGSNISVQNNTCGASLAVGASCTITFTSAVQEGPTTIPIVGDNTNTVNVDVTVDSPVISITTPIQQSRVVTVSGMTSLSLGITNDGSSLLNANAVTVSNKTACPNLIVDDSNCTSIAPGATCTLELSSTTPYAPCTITISGSNTANSPTTPIAFFHLNGLVFEESGGSGKVVTDLPQQLASRWTSVLSDIAGATSLTDGTSNTNAIVVDAACTGNPADCAAQLCRNIAIEWYLPAINELKSVADVLCPGGTCNFGGFENRPYWSSTQINIGFARIVVFPAGTISGDSKTASAPFDRVRCVRTFT